MKFFRKISLIFIFPLIAIHFFSINISPSIRPGIYFKVPRLFSSSWQKGDIILFCLDDKYAKLAVKSGILLQAHKSLSPCRLTHPLSKKIIAGLHDEVVFTKHFISVNGQTYFWSTIEKPNLEHFPYGKYHAKGFWVIGDNDSRSWDSRYFGEIEPKNILNKLLLVIPF